MREDIPTQSAKHSLSSRFSTVALISVETRLDVFDEVDGEQVKISYSCWYQKPHLLNKKAGKWVTIIHVGAKKYVVSDPKETTEISASYGVVYSASGDPSRDREDFVFAAWHRFSAIFDLVSGQMQANLPALPPQPPSVEEVEPESEPASAP